MKLWIIFFFLFLEWACHALKSKKKIVFDLEKSKLMIDNNKIQILLMETEKESRLGCLVSKWSPKVFSALSAGSLSLLLRAIHWFLVF